MTDATDVLSLTMTKLYKNYESLKVLGFKEPMYAPKNIPLQGVSFGSTGVHNVVRWDDGSWWCADGGDLWPYHPIMWRHVV